MAEEKKRPICPYCNQKMMRRKYIGYYDEFEYWDCDCGEEVPIDETWKGNYA